VPFPTPAFQDQFKPTPSPPATATPEPEYPGPTGADVPDVTVAYFDNFDTNAQYDANGDNLMYILTQGGVLDRASRVRALVQREYFHPQVPTDIALWTGGNLENKGGGGGVMPKVTAVLPSDTPPGIVASVEAVGLINADTTDPTKSIINNERFAAYDSTTDPHGRTLEEVFPTRAREAIIRYVKSVGRYFSEENAIPGKTPLQTAALSPETPFGGPGLAGMTVVENRLDSTSDDPVILRGTVQLNSETNPGLLMLLGGIGFTIGGDADFWGLLFVEGGTVTVDAGTPTIHGAMFSTLSVDFRGTLNLEFYPYLLQWLMFVDRPATVSMVPNTWRELQPR